MVKAIKDWWSRPGRSWDAWLLGCKKHSLNLYQTRLDEAEAAHRLSTAWLRREVDGLIKEIAEMEKGLGK